MSDYRIVGSEGNYTIQERHRFPMKFWWHDAKMGIFKSISQARFHIEKEIIPKVIIVTKS